MAAIGHILRPRFRRGVALSIVLSLSGCGSDAGPHGHEPGAHGGFIVSVGDDHYHMEALFESDGTLRLYTLNHDQTEVLPVDKQALSAYVRRPRMTRSVAVTLQPEPQRGDPEGTTSLFVGQLPIEFVNSPLVITVPLIEISGKRYHFNFVSSEEPTGPVMPAKVTDAAERELYLTPGGKYTAADIAANGTTTASLKYQAFHSAHDMNPQAGDRICPITGTKANAQCTWIVDGQRYEFCCPPCIDEFVKRAKTQPEELKKATAYVQE